MKKAARIAVSSKGGVCKAYGPFSARIFTLYYSRAAHMECLELTREAPVQDSTEQHNAKLKKLNALTPKAMKLLAAFIELEEDGKVSIDQLIRYMRASSKVVLEMIERLQKSRLLHVKSGQVRLYALTMEFAHKHYHIAKKQIPDQNFDVQDWVVSGPKSNFAGCRIYKRVQENPRRKGTAGWHAFNLYVDGMTFEDYRRRGGGNNHLKWDIDHNFVRIEYN